MPKILLVAHMGKPWGGISSLFEAIFQTEIRNNFNIRFLESSIPQEKTSLGKVGLRPILHSFQTICLFTFTIFNFKPDVIHIVTAHRGSFVKNGLLVVVSKFLQRKVILAPHCSFFALLPPNSSKIWTWWVKLILNRCDCLLVLSKEWMVLPPFIKAKLIKYLPNSINTEMYSIVKRSRKSSDLVNILFMGHISEEKGIFDLIQAINLLVQEGVGNFLVTITGEEIDIYELKEIKNQIRELNIEKYIHFQEPIFGNEKITCFSKSDIFILPSHHEGMPMVILEAMAASLPIIATNVGGIPDILEDGLTGILIPPRSTISLASEIKKLIQNPLMRLEMGKNGQKKAQRDYDIRKYIEKLGDIYLLMS